MRRSSCRPPFGHRRHIHAGARQLSLEFTGESSRDQESGGPTTEDSEAIITLTYGASDLLDLIIAVPYARVSKEHTEKGIGDVSLGAKWRIYSHDANSIALKPQLGLATGNERRGLGSGATTYSMTT